MARPVTLPVKLKAGYYIEVRRKGEQRGIKIRSENITELYESLKRYETNYDVSFYGRVENGKVADNKLPKAGDK